ncbi:hypothetical protein R5R35_009006 [Gryllus longicercus]|uniref:Odorant binding protein n=1 Tax=Gryllus longicercus TaxID=2509291 RepID=A0AAN9VIM3_9ORTH
MASCRYYTTVVLAALVCVVTAFPSGGEEPKFKCDDECKKEMQKIKDIVAECAKESGCGEEEFKKCKECGDDVPEKVQFFYACAAEKVGILDANRMINMDGLNTIEQKMDESCAKAPASDDEDPRKSFCDNKEVIKQAVRGCVEEGQKEQKEGDKGVAGTMAIRKCMCNYKKKN